MAMSPFVAGVEVSDLTVTEGIAKDSLDAVGDTFTKDAVNDNFAALAEKVNVILAALRSMGMVSRPTGPKDGA